METLYVILGIITIGDTFVIIFDCPFRMMMISSSISIVFSIVIIV